MPSNYQQTLRSLSEKAKLIAQRYNVAVEQRDRARAEAEDLNKELEKCRKEITLLKVQIENLTVVRTAFPTPQAVADSKKYLSGLVREIDQCIKDLTH